MERIEKKLNMSPMRIVKKFWNEMGDYLSRKGNKKSGPPPDELSDDDDLNLETRLNLMSDRRKAYHGVSSSRKENKIQSPGNLHGAIPKSKNGLSYKNSKCTEPKKMPKSKSKTSSSICDNEQLAGPVMTHKRPLTMVPMQVLVDRHLNRNSPNFSVNQEAKPRRSVRQLDIHQEVESPNVSFKPSPIVRAESISRFKIFDHLKIGNPFLLSSLPTIDRNRVKQLRRSQAVQVIDLDADESDDLLEIIETTPPPSRELIKLRKSVVRNSESPIFEKPKKLKRYEDSDDLLEVIETTPQPRTKLKELKESVEINSDSAIFDKPKKLKRYEDSDDLLEVIEITPQPRTKLKEFKESVEINSDSAIFDKPKKSKKCEEIILVGQESSDDDEPIYNKPKSSKVIDEILRELVLQNSDSKNGKKIRKKSKASNCVNSSSEFDANLDYSKCLKTENSKELTCSTISHDDKNNNVVLSKIKMLDEKQYSGIKIREEKTFSSSNFHVDNYLKRSNNAFHCFMDRNRVCQYNRTCLTFLHNHFNGIRDDTITNTYRDSNYNMSIAANELRKMQNNIGCNIKKVKSVEPDNLEQFQEMEFIRKMNKCNDLNEESEANKICLISL